MQLTDTGRLPDIEINSLNDTGWSLFKFLVGNGNTTWCIGMNVLIGECQSTTNANAKG